ncbi:MAG TPA: hypothetical protein VF060_27535 [Trebonia sp.]
MAYADSASGWSPGKITVVAVLAIIGVLAIIAGILYFTEPARSLPSVLGAITSPASRANAHRDLRGAVALVIGVILLAAAWFAARSNRSAAK